MDRFIDIHNHLIPEFDDGPKTVSESLDMLKMALDQGITEVFATSHFTEYIPEKVKTEYCNKLQALREEALAHNLKINIYSGAELFFHHYLDETVRKNRITTLGGFGQYVLLEFPMFQSPEGVEDVLFRLSVDQFIPIVAHPERYNAVMENSTLVHQYIRHGALLQVNAGSIMGDFGKAVQETAMELLENQLIHFIASDAHSSSERKFRLREVYQTLKEHLPQAYLQKLLYQNPRSIIDEVVLEKVALPAEPEKEGLIKKILRFFQ
ncbi:MAG: CpsB/CapC family capsule biosynthesis tyrosine phosphatase [Calditrichia bacterium]